MSRENLFQKTTKLAFAICTALLTFSFSSANAQIISQTCLYDSINAQPQQQTLQQAEQAVMLNYLDNFVMTAVSNAKSSLPTKVNTKYYIPVVLHVTDGSLEIPSSVNASQGNINDVAFSGHITNADILNFIALLNNRFKAVSTCTIAERKLGDIDVEFCLAQIAPGGQPWSAFTSSAAGVTTPAPMAGVTRSGHVSSSYIWPAAGAGGGIAGGWSGITYSQEFDPFAQEFNRYCNILVIPGASVGGNIIAMAARHTGTPVDGMIFPEAIVKGLSTLYSTGGLLAHEAGHYLWLEHTTASGCSTTTANCANTGDFCCDTYPYIGGVGNSCTTANACSGHPAPNFQNYMGGFGDLCMDHFTNDQNTRMTASIELFRAQIATKENLVATGIIGPTGCLNNLVDATFTTNLPSEGQLACTGQQFIARAMEAPPTTSFTYLWNTPGATSTINTNVCSLTYSAPGVYTIELTVIQAGGGQIHNSSKEIIVTNCTVNKPIMMMGNDVVITTGSFTITTSVPAPGFTFSTSGGNLSSSNVLTTASLGPYTVTATQGSCSFSTVINVNATPTITPIITPSSYCTGQTITIGVGNTYTITSINGTTPNLSNISSFTVAATTAATVYNIECKDANGCTGTASVTIATNAIPVLTLSATPIVCLGGTTTITPTISGASGSYTYSISSGTLTTASAGTYTVTGTNGTCIATSTVTIPDGTVTLSASATAIACHGGNTTITPTISGTSQPFTYALNPGGITTSPFIVAANTYTITATSASCTLSTIVSILNPAPLNVATVNATGPCVGASNGVITLSGGNTSYTYALALGTNSYPVGSSLSVTGLSAGTYTLTTTDPISSCTTTSTIAVNTIANQINYNISFPTVTCAGSNSTLTPLAGGTSYTIEPGTFITTGTPVALSAISVNTVYTITASDGTCNTSTTLVLTAIASTDPKCACAPTNPTDYTLITNGNNTTLTNALVLATGTTTITNKKIVFKGAFTLTDNLTFEGCDIRMAPDLDASGNNKTTINCASYDLTFIDYTNGAGINTPTTVQGCTHMWQGITANTPNMCIAGLQPSITIKNSYISDMIQGIQLHPGFSLVAENSHFIDNLTGIYTSGNNTVNHIFNSDFETTVNAGIAGMRLAPYAGQLPRHGIKAYNNNTLIVGDDTNPSTGNRFTNLQNGIFAFSNVKHSTWPGNTVAGSSVISNYNKFTHIRAGQPLWAASTPFQTYEGAAIYCRNTVPAHNASVQVIGNPSTATTLSTNFEDCNSACVSRGYNHGFAANKLIGTDAGAIALEMNNKHMQVSNNKMEDVMLGVLKSGYHGGFPKSGPVFDWSIFFNWMVFGNHIILTTMPAGGYSQAIKGDCPYTFGATTNPSFIWANLIYMPNEDKAAGIYLMNNASSYVADNEIFLTNNTASTYQPYVPGALPAVTGIMLNNCNGSTLQQNYISSLSSSITSATNINATGIYLVRNEALQINCNAIDHTRHGILAVGPNRTANFDKIYGNRFISSSTNLLLTPLAGEGTVGNIGNEALLNGPLFDGANAWQGAAVNKNIYRDNPLCTAATMAGVDNKIATATTGITRGSSSPAILCIPIIVGVAAGTPTIGCNPSLPPPKTKTNNWPPKTKADAQLQVLSITNPDMAPPRAVSIAAENDEFFEFEPTARALDQRFLIEYLARNSGVRAQYPILDSFYLASQDGVLDAMNHFDEVLASLGDSLATNDSATYYTRLDEASEINDGLEGATTYFVEQEHWVNTMLLQSLKGEQELSAMQHEQLRILALTCPYLAGRAAYKARSLEADYLATKIVNERQLCNSQGVYRQAGHALPVDVTVLANKLQLQFAEGNPNPCLIYPNPVHNILYIATMPRTNDRYLAQVFDATGKLIATKNLLMESQLNSLDVGTLSTGIYTIRCVFGDGVNFTGKFTKL
jgi:hypothetical protein